jgi:hypothetical protein
MSKGVRDVDHGYREFFERMTRPGAGASVKVGVLGDPHRGGLHKTDPDTGASSPLTVAEIALVNEFGTEDGKIPARAAHRQTFDRRVGEIDRESVAAVEAILDGKITAADALAQMGAKHAAEIRATITEGSGVPPPNAPSVLRRKEEAGKWNAAGDAQAAGDHPRPLVDTGATVAAISYAVEADGRTGDAKFIKGE